MNYFFAYVKKFNFRIIRKFLNILLLLTPDNLKINLYFLIYFFDENKENELFNLKSLIFKKGIALDVGCNIGLYSYALSKQKKILKVYSFEPNKNITKFLKKNDNNKIEIINIALSNKNKKNKLITPIFKNILLDGWASVENKIKLNKKFNSFTEVNVKCKRLDDFKLKNVTFIKIDVEGHELKLLRGAVDFFKLNKPSCLIEIKKNNFLKVAKFFKLIDVNYKCIPKKNFSFNFAKENYFFSVK